MSESSVRMHRILCVTYAPNQILYLKASNCVDEQEWFSVLNRVTISNQDNTPRFYHPANFDATQWSCCKSADRNAKGCIQSTNQSAINDLISEAVDPDREIAHIQSLLLSKETAMNQLYENCSNMIKECERRDAEGSGDANESKDANESRDANESKGANSGTKETLKLRESVYNSSLIEDPKSFIETLDALRSAVNQLRVDEDLFIKKEVIDTVYGSKSTPIGDDRYLSLIKKHAKG